MCLELRICPSAQSLVGILLFAVAMAMANSKIISSVRNEGKRGDQRYQLKISILALRAFFFFRRCCRSCREPFYVRLYRFYC